MAIIVATGISLSLPKIYRAEATLLLPQKSGTSGAPVSLVGSLSLPVDLSSYLSLGSSSNYVDILKSRSIAEMVLNDLEPDKVNKGNLTLKEKNQLVGTLKNSVKVKDEKGLIKISAEHQNPRMAADIANYYAIALDKFNQRANIQVASRTRKFVKGQLDNAKAELNQAEDKLKKFQDEITLVRERARELTLGRLLREVKIKEAVYTLLSQEYEKAKIEEAKEGQFFEFLDPAYPPELPAKPRIKVNIAIAALLGLSAGILWAFFLEYLDGIGVKTPK